MADDKAKPDVSKPKEPPKPVQLGGESLLDRILPHIKKIAISTVILAVLISFFFGSLTPSATLQALMGLGCCHAKKMLHALEC